MANEKNLQRGTATQFRSGEEAAKNGKKGGIASGEKRRENKRLRDIMKSMLERVEPEWGGLTLLEQAALMQCKAAAQGDLKAFECVTKIAGEYLTDVNDKNEFAWD